MHKSDNASEQNPKFSEYNDFLEEDEFDENKNLKDEGYEEE
ncbi:MAG: hypothetical protein AABW67_03420 [Nanoarchaeota archaeon]